MSELNISRPPEHRWKPTHYTHAGNPPYKRAMPLSEAVNSMGVSFKDAGLAFAHLIRQFGKAQKEGLL